MKGVFALVFAAIALFCAVQADHILPNGVNVDNLKKDLRDFENILPLTRFALIFEKHRVFDQNFNKALQFLKSAEYPRLGSKIANSIEFQALYKHLKSRGWLENPALLLEVNEAVKDDESSEENTDYMGRISPRNMLDFLSEIIAAVPKDNFVKLINQKLASSPDFKALYTEITSAEVRQLVNAILTAPELQSTFNELASNGVDFKQIEQKIRQVLSWKN